MEDDDDEVTGGGSEGKHGREGVGGKVDAEEEDVGEGLLGLMRAAMENRLEPNGVGLLKKRPVEVEVAEESVNSVEEAGSSVWNL